MQPGHKEKLLCLKEALKDSNVNLIDLNREAIVSACSSETSTQSDCIYGQNAPTFQPYLEKKDSLKDEIKDLA